MNEQHIREVFSDEKYVLSLLAMQSYEDVQKSLAEKEIDISVKDLRKIRELLSKKISGELTDAELEEITGGELLTGFLVICGIVCGGATVYTAVCAIRKC